MLTTRKSSPLKSMFVAIVAVMGLSFAPAEGKPQAAKSRTDNSSIWQIDYFPGQISSASTVYLGKDAIQICTQGLYEITAKAPSWTAVVVNKKTKMFCELPPSKWIKEGFFLDPPEPDYMNPKGASANEKLDFRGLTARRMTWETVESDQFYRYRVKPQRCIIELIQTDGSIPASKMQLEILSVWYGIPKLSGVPLFWQNVMSKEKTLRLKVANVQRIPASSVTFKATGGCAKQASMMKLVDNKFSNALNDFIEFEQDVVPSKQKSKGALTPAPTAAPKKNK